MARIKCAHCKQYHAYVWEVRQCAVNHEAISIFNEPAPKPVNIGTSVPEGHYAIHDPQGGWKFYRVSRPVIGKWAGRVFVDIQASDEYHPIRHKEVRNMILEAIAEVGAKESMLAYGQQLGKCGVCNRTLTNAESIAASIGPVCAKRMGW